MLNHTEGDNAFKMVIPGAHKTGVEAPVNLHPTVGKSLMKFLEVHKKHFSQFRQWGKLPLFATEEGSELKNLSTVISRTSESLVGKRVGVTKSRHMIHTMGPAKGIPTDRISGALFHSSTTAISSYKHITPGTAFVG